MLTFLLVLAAMTVAVVAFCNFINGCLEDLEDFLSDDNDWPGSPRL